MTLLLQSLISFFFYQWTVQIEPNFHEDANNLEDLVPFEECIELHSTEKAVVRAPEYLLLTHNGRSFKSVSISLLNPLWNHSEYIESFKTPIIMPN